jgi:hypothetical protein
MTRLASLTIALIALAATVIAPPHISAWSEPTSTNKQNSKLPKSGLLAVSSISGATSSTTGETFGGDTLFDPELPPLSGSIYRKDERTVFFSVTNNSTDRYSVNVDVLQKDQAGRTLKFSSYSHTLKAHESLQERALADRNASRFELFLRSYRNLSAEQRARQEQR